MRKFVLLLFMFISSQSYGQTLTGVTLDGAGIGTCNMLLITDSYAGVFLAGNDNSTKLLGCDFYKPIDPTSSFSGYNM